MKAVNVRGLAFLLILPFYKDIYKSDGQHEKNILENYATMKFVLLNGTNFTEINVVVAEKNHYPFHTYSSGSYPPQSTPGV